MFTTNLRNECSEYVAVPNTCDSSKDSLLILSRHVDIFVFYEYANEKIHSEHRFTLLLKIAV